MYGSQEAYSLLRDKPQTVVIIRPRVEEKLKSL